MIATLIIILTAFTWLAYETDWFTIRLESQEYQWLQIARRQAVKLQTANKPVLMLTAGNPANYPMTLTITVQELKELITQLSKTDLELIEEVWDYDYSDQT